MLRKGDWPVGAQSSSRTPIPNKFLTIIKGSDTSVPHELSDHPQYTIIRELGRGGMGVVYLARNKLMDRLEVLKVINQELLGQPGARDRFLREIRAAAKLSHENIVKAHSAMMCGDLLVFVMEFAEGEDLAKIVRTHGPMPVANACSYVQQAALGLQHAFEKGLVHRDIKPQNLILARINQKQIVKLLDFGLAKARREAGGTEFDLTGSGQMLGTPDYIAPEQMRDAAKADIRADIYSLGCTLYFLLTGAPPFKAKSLFELLQSHLLREAKPLYRVRGEIPT
jgi:serine/threonine protein kinase